MQISATEVVAVEPAEALIAALQQGPCELYRKIDARFHHGTALVGAPKLAVVTA